MYGFLKPPAQQEVGDFDSRFYTRMRWQVFLGIFVGYAGYYLVRKNFTLVMPYLIETGEFTKTELGIALSGVSIAYGLSKFLMGSVSDRSNSRYFMAIGLFVSASIMITMGLVPLATSTIPIMFTLLLINGWFQGMGWPPSGRVMVHWFSPRERGTWMSFWNVAHNIGAFLIGPLAIFAVAWIGDWHSILYVHGFFALAIVVIILFAVRDTPQSQGLPPIEEYNQDYPVTFGYASSHENEFSTADIFFKYVLTNRLLWSIAIANAFVYLVRYGVLDWAPTYLQAEKGFTFDESSWAYSFYELAGIPGTIVCGFLSDKVFQGRRAPAVIIFMFLTTICIVVYWLNPSGQPSIDIAMLICIGFLIYGPVMLIGVFALDLVPKKSAGTAAGFTGLFGYVGGSLTASIFIPWIVEYYGDNWDAGFLVIIAACVMAIVLTAFTIKAEMQSIQTGPRHTSN